MGDNNDKINKLEGDMNTIVANFNSLMGKIGGELGDLIPKVGDTIQDGVEKLTNEIITEIESESQKALDPEFKEVLRKVLQKRFKPDFNVMDIANLNKSDGHVSNR